MSIINVQNWLRSGLFKSEFWKGENKLVAENCMIECAKIKTKRKKNLNI